MSYLRQAWRRKQLCCYIGFQKTCAHPPQTQNRNTCQMRKDYNKEKWQRCHLTLCNYRICQGLIKDGYLKPSSTLCLPPAESCGPFIMYVRLRTCWATRTSHHWKLCSITVQPCQCNLLYCTCVLFSMTGSRCSMPHIFLSNYHNSWRGEAALLHGLGDQWRCACQVWWCFDVGKVLNIKTFSLR